MVNRPKGKLFALLAVFVAIGLVTASGAFTSVEAERTVSVSTSGDGSALLQLEQVNTDYTSITDNQLEISISSINLNAVSDLGVVFNITNNGNDDLSTIYIADQDGELPSGSSFSLGDSTGDTVSYRADTNPDGTSTDTGTNGNIEGSNNSTALNTGSTIDIKIVIDTKGETSTGNLGANNIVIVAEQS